MGSAEIKIPLLLFPPPGYFTYFLGKTNAALMMGEQYVKQTIRTRFVIDGANGPQTLVCPVKGSSKKLGISGLTLDHSEGWLIRHRRSLESAYRKSPYFEHYYPLLEPLLTFQYHLLAEFSMEALKIVMQIMDISSDLTLDFLPEKARPEFEQELPLGGNYHQVFGERKDFVPGLSVLDLLFNEGPWAAEYIRNIPVRT